MKETNLCEIQTKAMEHAKRKLTESVMQKATEIMYLKKKYTDRKRREKHSVKPRLSLGIWPALLYSAC